jgi:hypothetical protein
MDFTGVIAKINPFFIIFTEICAYLEAEKVPLFCKNLVRACGPLGHTSGGGWGAGRGVAPKIGPGVPVSETCHKRTPNNMPIMNPTTTESRTNLFFYFWCNVMIMYNPDSPFQCIYFIYIWSCWELFPHKWYQSFCPSLSVRQRSRPHACVVGYYVLRYQPNAPGTSIINKF